MPGYMVVPPDSTILACRSLQILILHDAVEGLMDATGLHTQEDWTPESLIASGDHRQLITLLQGRGECCSWYFLLKIQGNIVQLLPNSPLSSGSKTVVPLSQNLHEVVYQVPASQVQMQDGVEKGESLLWMVIVCMTSSLESMTMPVMCPDAYKNSTAWRPHTRVGY